MEGQYLVDERYEDGAGRFRFVILRDSLVALARFRGNGSVPGTKEFARMLEEATNVLPAGSRVRAVADLRELSKTPMRAQFILGKWLFANRSKCGRIAVVGASAWERKLATAVFKVARLTDIGFLASMSDAETFMDMPITMPELV